MGRKLLLIGYVAAVAACGDGASDVASSAGSGGQSAGSGGKSSAGATSGGMPGSDSDTPEGFCTALLELSIGFYVRCSGASAESWRQFLQPEFVCGNAAEAVENGRLTFSSSDAEACLTSLEASADSAPCGDDPGADELMDASCRSALEGAVPVGGSCLSFHIVELFGECADGGFCDQGGVESCAGTCQARGGLGDLCGVLNDAPPCGSDLSCSHDECMTPAALDEACEGPDAPHCAEGLYCEGGGAAQEGICRVQKTSGACADNDECASLHFCDDAGSCMPYRGVGETCAPGARECFPLLSYCAAGECAARMPRLGEACGTIDGESAACAEGCCDNPDATQGVCVPKKQPGEACTGTPTIGECAGDAGRCDTTSMECTACQRQ